MNATQLLLVAQLDSRREGFTAGELATLVEKGETTVRENLKKLVVDGEVVKDGKNFRRPNHTTPVTVHTAEDGSVHEGEFAACQECTDAVAAAALDATMREQMATEPEKAEDETTLEQDDLENALRESLEAEAAKKAEAEKPAKKKYAPRRENPTRPIRKNQKTGSELQVVPRSGLDDWMKTLSEELIVNVDVDDVDDPWFTICHTHSTFTGAKKIMAAWGFSTNPEKFCTGCKDALAAKSSK